MADVSKDLPTIFRIDCIGELKMTKQHFNIHYNDKFNERDINKRVQFMYSSELRKIKFEFNGSYIEAVLDILTTA